VRHEDRNSYSRDDKTSGLCSRCSRSTWTYPKKRFGDSRDKPIGRRRSKFSAANEEGRQTWKGKWSESAQRWRSLGFAWKPPGYSGIDKPTWGQHEGSSAWVTPLQGTNFLIRSLARSTAGAAFCRSTSLLLGATPVPSKSTRCSAYLSGTESSWGLSREMGK
jgi:hypothetical protein